MSKAVNFQRIGSTRRQKSLNIKSKTRCTNRSHMTYKMSSFIKAHPLVQSFLNNRAPVRTQVKIKISVSQRLKKWLKALPSVESQLRNRNRNRKDSMLMLTKAWLVKDLLMLAQ